MRFFAAALIFFGAVSFGQTPEVPHKIQFAGMTLTVRDDARLEIQKDVDALTMSPRYFNIKVERAKTYFPLIEEIFRQERLPDDFKYLVLQESALISDAVSVSDAVGYWQFKDFTAEEMGMRVDHHIDERMNIISSTHAAAKYLKKNNYYFNNWLYALQSYQMGAGGVMRAVGDKHNGARHMEINGDTYWYVKKYLAHKIAFESAINGEGELKLVPYETKNNSISQIAKELQADEAELLLYNKWALKGEIPDDKRYTVLVPVGKFNSDFTKLNLSSPSSEPVVAASSPLPIEENLFINGIPVIKAGDRDRITTLADRAGVKVSAFLKYNDISIDHVVKPGALYFIDKKKNHSTSSFHKVKAGENIWVVSQTYGVKIRKLRKYNRIDETQRVAENSMLWLSFSKPRENDNPEDIVTLDDDRSFNWGTSVTGSEKDITSHDSRDIPNESQTSPGHEKLPDVTESSQQVVFHEVKPADTIYGVARYYGVTIKELMDWNGKKDFSLEVGEKLKITPN